MSKLQNVRLALVTGATSGIGQELAIALRALGIEVIGVGRSGETLVADLATDGGREKVVAVIRERQPDLVINCAGLGYYGEAAKLTVDQQLEILEVNMTALAQITLETLHTWTAQKMQGTVMNVSSAAAFITFPLCSAYAASKTFVNAFSKNLDSEVASKGMRVLANCPGEVTTQFRKRASMGKSQDTSSYSKDAKSAAKAILNQIERGRGVEIFDWRTRWVIRISNLFPRSWQIGLLRRRMAERSELI